MTTHPNAREPADPARRTALKQAAVLMSSSLAGAVLPGLLLPASARAAEKRTSGKAAGGAGGAITPASPPADTAADRAKAILGRMPIEKISQQLRARRLTSSALVDAALKSIDASGAQANRIFASIHREAAKSVASERDQNLRRGRNDGRLHGIPVTVQDLIDEAGQVTRAGATTLDDTPAAERDAPVVEHLRKAGAIIIGRTNMSEFGLDPVGLNANDGTPTNAHDSTRAPGGASSGAALAVARGMAAASIGIDSSGSMRVPAALNGVVAFKATQHRLSVRGTFPVAPSYDSIGITAAFVDDIVLLDRVISTETAPPPRVAARSLRIAVPENYFNDGLSTPVARVWSRALKRLADAGVSLFQTKMDVFDISTRVDPRGIVTAVEAWSWHRHILRNQAENYAPRTLARIREGEQLSAADYVELQALRRSFIRQVNEAFIGYDAVLAPTTIDIAPTLEEMRTSDEAWKRAGARLARNAAIVNVFDGCALSLPCHDPGEAPVGMMLMGSQGNDARVLAVGAAFEEALRGAREKEEKVRGRETEQKGRKGKARG